jgi:hypothetical protein
MPDHHSYKTASVVGNWYRWNKFDEDLGDGNEEEGEKGGVLLGGFCKRYWNFS